MTEKRKYPFLAGGLCLTLLIWLLETLNHTLGEWGIYALFLGAAGGVVLWLRYQPGQRRVSSQLPQAVDTVAVRKALAEAEKVLFQLGSEVEDPQEPASVVFQPQVSRFQAQISQIATDMNRDEIRLVVMGAKGCGKTTLVEQIRATGAANLRVWEVPALFMAEADSTAEIQTQAIAADLVLFLVTGDITEPEFQAVKQLVGTKRTLLVFNKQDQYLPADRQMILQQIQKRGQGVLKAGDVVAIAAAPNPLKVRQHQTDGSVAEWLEDQPPNISELTQRLTQILQQESQQLVLASSFTSARVLEVEVKTVLNDVRRTRALPVVEQYQWIAAGTAFASPLPAMDLVATVAINAQLIHDLGAIYQQKISFQQAQKVATALGSLMLKLGLVELSTQAIAGLLKSNAFTYLAGGCIQGISAAYLTRIVGFTLVEYYSSQEPNLTLNEASPLAIERFSQILQRVFQQNQQVAFLQLFVNQAMDSFSGVFPPSQLAATDSTLLMPSTPHTPHPTPHTPLSASLDSTHSPS